MTLSPTSLAFPEETVGTTSTPLVVTLTNTGTATLTLSSFTMTGADAGDYSQTNNCGTSVAAGANCTISVTFKPHASAQRTASLSISDNAAGSPQTVGLSGIGTFVQLVPTSLTFSSQAVGTTSTAQAVIVTNTLPSATITISIVTITGTNPGDFAETNTCGTLAAGATCAISVTFTPAAAGTRTALVSITDNGGGSPQTVHLSGTGT